MGASVSVMNTGAFSQLISRDFKQVFFDAYARMPSDYESIANISNMDGAYIREGQAVGLSALQAIGEGEPISYDAFLQGNEKTVTPTDFALGVAITRNMYDDDRTGIMKKAMSELGKAAAYTRELAFWDLLNAASVNTTRTGIDGTGLCMAHTPIDGGTAYSNFAATASSLSMTTLQSGLDNFAKLKNERGIACKMPAKVLVVPPELRWKAELLTGSSMNYENANNEPNTREVKGLRVVVCPFLSTTTQWHLLADKSDHDLRFIWRKQLQMQATDDFDSRTAKFMAVMRLAVTFFGWRGVYTNAGA